MFSENVQTQFTESSKTSETIISESSHSHREASCSSDILGSNVEKIVESREDLVEDLAISLDSRGE